MSSPQTKSADSEEAAPPQTAGDVPNLVTPDLDIPKEITDHVATTLPAERQKAGRPAVEFTDEVRWAILELLTAGLSLSAIGEIDGLPSTKTIGRWRMRDKAFGEEVHEAIHISIQLLDDRALGTAEEVREVKTEADLPIMRGEIERAEFRHRVFKEAALRRRGDLALMNAPAAAANGDDAKQVIDADYEVVATQDDPRFAEAIAKFEAATGVDSKLYLDKADAGRGA